MLCFITTQLSAQKVGIGTTTPKALLHVADSGIIFSSPNPLSLGVTVSPLEQGGIGFMWHGAKAVLRVGEATGAQWSAYLSGHLSTTFGSNNTALGTGSFAAGQNNYTSGQYSMSLGSNNTDISLRSVAIGNNNSASGHESTALGKGTNAYAYQSTALGRYNVLLGDNDTEISSNPLLVIGNGTADNNRSNALTILKNGNIGIGAVNPAVKLQVSAGHVLFTKRASETAADIISPITEDGYYTYWNAGKGAFRSGYFQFDELRTDSLGSSSVAMGYGSMAKAAFSTAVGLSARATGQRALSIGSFTESPSYSETTVGSFNQTYVQSSTSNWVPTDRLFTIGNGAGASTRSNAMVILKNGNTGIGINQPTASLHVKEKMIIDQPAASGLASVEWRSNNIYRGGLGFDTDAGRFFFYDGESGQNVFFVNNGRFGVRRDATTNALEVGGDASKSTAGSWLGNSDARLKKNLQPVTHALEKLLALKGIRYEWNDDKTGYARPTGVQYGFTAQNVQEVFPELVSTDAQGYLQTAYGTYDPLIIEAIRELKKENDSLKAEIEKLKIAADKQ